MPKLKTIHDTALPLRELSALALRTTADGEVRLLAVGDEDFAVISAALDDEGRPVETKRHDLFLALVGTGIDLRNGSGFEGIAADAAGNVYILQEEESRLLVFDPDLSRLDRVIALDVPPDTPGFGQQWHEKTNERAEGLLLRADGHVLVAKQKNDAFLIDFAPTDDPDVLQPFAWWPLDLKSANDLAVDGAGRVHVLSSKEQVLVRLAPLGDSETAAVFEHEWELDGLPEGDEAHPEGLVVLAGGTPVVAVDSKVAGDNVAVLAAI